MLKIMATPGEDDEDDSLEEESSESQSPITLAGQVLHPCCVVVVCFSIVYCCFVVVKVLDVLSLNLPPDRIYPPVVSNIGQL